MVGSGENHTGGERRESHMGTVLLCCGLQYSRTVPLCDFTVQA